jgi:hypothetical protein
MASDDPVLKELVLPPEVPPPKPGYTTSELYVTLLAMIGAIAAQIEGSVPAPYGAIIASVLALVYQVGRVWLKSRSQAALPTPTV